MKKRAMRCGAPLVALALFCAMPAGAQEEPSAADMGAARALGQEGVKLAEAGNCEEAVDKLSRAEKIFHAPTTLARLGECQVQLGKVVEGTENLNRVSRENLAPTAPAAFREAQERARKVLADAKPRIAKLKIAVAAPAGVQFVVKLDGEPVPAANLNTNRPTDPGEHVVEASAPGYKNATAKVRLADGALDSVALTLEVDPNAPKTPLVAPTAPGTAPGAPPPEGTGPRNRLPAYVALGVGAVGLGVGAIFGIVALGKKSDLDSACSNKVCPSASQQDTIDSGKTFGTISTVGFVVGVVGAGVGTVLLLTGGSSSASSSSAASATSPLRVKLGSARIEPAVSTDRVGFVGSF
jgi:hypothetical protein